MSQATVPASANFEKLKQKLRELFELDKADLDFGIYRILRQRHREIVEFLDRHLEKAVREALLGQHAEERAQLEADLRKAGDAARAAGIAPEQSPRVAELNGRLAAAAGGLQETADEVYSHLYTFFSRYYQEGDFLGLQRSTVHGREKYVIPYNGEELKMVWANMDQYYIKSSELLQDYRFRVVPNEGPLFQEGSPREFLVEFKLVEGDTEKDNRESDDEESRVFRLDAHKPLEEVSPNQLRIRFRYAAQAGERSSQDKINADTARTLHNKLSPSWRALLLDADQGERTLLQTHLQRYTARHQFDYFIHKDLEGFLRRELDFYIKNEVVYLDDIENSSAPKVEVYLSKIRALRCSALPVVRMLAQIENFQKRLWLKKKFVVETRYCVTMDRVPESLYPDICANDSQWDEWNTLYSLQEIPNNLFSVEARTPGFLKAQPQLMIDTRHFSQDFVRSLLRGIDDHDSFFDGLCINSENFSAMSLIQRSLQGVVKCVYADPPYNTDAGPILYKNGYRSSSWLCMIQDRLAATRSMAAEDAILCITIDDYQGHELALVLNGLFGRDHQMGTAVIRNNPSGRATVRGFSVCHEYAYFYRYGDLASLSRFPRTEHQLARFSEEEGVKVDWRNFRKDGGSVTHRSKRPKQYYPIYARLRDGALRIPQMEWRKEDKNWQILDDALDDEVVVWPIDEKGRDRVWSLSHITARANLTDLELRLAKGEAPQIYRRHYPSDGVLPRSWWDKNTYAAREYGSAVLTQLFGVTGAFSFAKSPYAVQDCLWISGLDGESDGTVLDIFAGSGTTAHSILNLNRTHAEAQRKYVLVEMGAYIDTVIIPRIAKVVYSPDWKDGKPLSRNSGVSHALKIIRLESYEDTLNNLRLQRKDSYLPTTEWQQDEYMLGYFLDLESEGSASLLDTSRFTNPFSYQLDVASRTVGDTKPTNVDVVETFNWLIGLRVKHIEHQKGFVTVTGETRAGERCLIIWRILSGDLIADDEILENYLSRIGVKPADTEYALIYVNGSHTLADPHNKIHLTEEEFQRRMFEDEAFESLE